MQKFSFVLAVCFGILTVQPVDAKPEQRKPKTVAKAPASKAKQSIARYAHPWSPRKDNTGFYGFKNKEKAQKVTLAKLMTDTDKYKGKFVEVKGKVRDVCRKKGCWLMLTDGKHLMRVRFKGYKFFVPTNSTGYGVIVRGYGRRATISARLAKHYAEESGDKAAAKKITGPQRVVAFTAHSVRLFKLKK